MRVLLSVCLVGVGACPSAYGVIFNFLETPHDNPAVRETLVDQPGAQRLFRDYSVVFDRYFSRLNSSQAPMVFGRRLRRMPADYALAVFMPKSIAVSGRVVEDNKRHVDTYALDDLGYIRLFFHWDGETLEGAALFFRTDKTFVPLRSSADIPNRIKWEQKKWTLLKEWLRTQWVKNSKSARVLF